MKISFFTLRKPCQFLENGKIFQVSISVKIHTNIISKLQLSIIYVIVKNFTLQLSIIRAVLNITFLISRYIRKGTRLALRNSVVGVVGTISLRADLYSIISLQKFSRTDTFLKPRFLI